MNHPANDPDYGKTIDTPVWYLAHPLAPDDRFTFQQNMNHIVHMMRLCYDEGFRVIAPYHTICLALDDNNAEHRRVGLECDIYVVKCLRRIILTGHKRSTGMMCEYNALLNYGDHKVIDVVGLNDMNVRNVLRGFKSNDRV